MPAFCTKGVLVTCLAASLSLGFAPPSLAQTQAGWEQCGAELQIPTLPAHTMSRDEAAQADPAQVRMGADNAVLEEGKRSVLTGNVVMEKGAGVLASDKAIYDAANETFDSQGNVRYWDGETFLSGSRAQIEFDTDVITVDNANFIEPASHGRGDATRLSITGSDLIRIQNGTYTTCNPGDPDWMLEARRIDLDQVADWGTARDVKVLFKGVPIFYSPYLTFPLSNQRKSGFLASSVRMSGEAGSEITIPYYFNIAPNQDATLSARLTTLRGAIVAGEYRYLFPWGEGELDAEFIPNDSEHGGARGLFKYRHRSALLADKLRTEIHYDRVSDRDYFSDLGDSLAVSSTTHLRQRANVDYFAGPWWARARVESFQTVDGSLAGSGRPYRRLPQLLISSSKAEQNRALNISYHGEFVRFERSESVTGTRFDAFPSVSFPVRAAGWFVVPRASLRYTAYSLSGVSAGGDNSPDRLTPAFSLDSGMFFERSFDIGKKTYISTLEPRLYYLGIPYRDQRDIPIFDTGRYTFNFGQLFRSDRFSGADRVGDTNQLTVALTSRVLGNNGGELARASVGQILYFRRRAVTLTNDDPLESRRSSDFIAEVAGTISKDWAVKAGIQWNPHDEKTQKHVLGLRYQPDSERVVNLTYRSIAGQLEQVDTSVRWPWSHNLNLVGRMHYSLADHRTLETFGGLEYESCCWAMRAVARRFLSSTNGDYTNGVFLQLELKGLAGIGKEAGAFLKRSIPGYQNDF
jgi:LPS-assembly protein